MLIFGTAGIPRRAKGKPLVEGLRVVKELGLGMMELEFVRGVRMSPEQADAVAEVASSLGLVLTVHAPYYINLNSDKAKTVKASMQRIMESARVGYRAGARDIVFHPGYYGSSTPREALTAVKERMAEMLDALREEGVDVILRPETTGKPTQIGSLEEVLLLSQELDRVLPCVDFAHLHARSGGGLNTPEEFDRVLGQIADALGEEALGKMHIHISGIEYTQKGERRHLPLEDSDLAWKELLSVLADRGVAGTVVSESPIIEDDALLMQKFYLDYVKGA